MKTQGAAAAWLFLWLFVLVVAGCYAGRDCKPGQACWRTCAEDPGAPGCVQPWEPNPIGANHDGGTDR